MEDPKLALFLRAESFRLANNFEDAIPLYEKILELDPHDGGARKVLAELYLIFGDREKGVRAYWELAQEHRRRGEPEKVTPILRKIRVLDAGATLDVTQAALRMLAEIDAQEDEEGGAGATTSERTRAELELGEEKPEINLDSPLFGSLPADEMKKLVKALHMVRGRRGTIIFREGDLTRSLFVIAEGAIEIRARTTTSSGSIGDSRVAQLGPGELFGEFSFLTGAPRSATARVSSEDDALLYMLSREAMEALAAEESAFVKVLDSYYRQRALDLIFARSALFAGLPVDDRRRVAACFELRSFPRGSVLIEEGKPGDDFYLVKSGEVEILRATPDGGKALLALLGPNQFFGEISFLMGKPRSASAVATSEAEILVISGEALREVVAHYPSVRSQLEKARLRRAVETAKRLAGRGVTSPPSS